MAGCASAPPPREIPKVYHTVAHAENVHQVEPCTGYVGNADLAGVGLQLPGQAYREITVFDNGAHLGVPANVSAIILDLWWDHGASVAVRSQATAPDGSVTLSEARQGADSDHPIRLRFDHPMPGNWEWKGVADPVAAGVVLHFNEGIYVQDTPEALGFGCNSARAANGG